MSRIFAFIALLLLVSACATAPDVYHGGIVSDQKIISNSVAPATTAEKKDNIALILPMGAQKDQVGASIIKAAQLAIENAHDPAANLVFINSDLIANDPDLLKATLKTSKVKAIIGPVYTKETENLAALLANDNISILSLSNDSSVSGSSLLMMGVSPDSQANAITNYAIGLGINHFHLLIPNNKYGKLINNAVANIVTSKNNVNYEVTWYSTENDTVVIDELIAGIAGSKAHDQAIFMPQGGAHLTILNAALEKYKLKIKLFGSSAWDNPNILNLPMLNGAILLKKDLYEQQFFDDYQRTFNAAPNNIDVIAYNALSMILKMHKNGQIINKQNIIAENPTKFDTNGASLYSFSILEIENGEFKLLDIAQ